MSTPAPKHRVVFNVYKARSKRGTRLVYFHPQCETGAAWLRERGAPSAGIFVSCARSPEAGYLDHSHASLLAFALHHWNGFSIRLLPRTELRAPLADDAPGFGYRIDGAVCLRLYTQPPIGATEPRL